jgi:flagellar basal-body rod protein FlgF
MQIVGAAMQADADTLRVISNNIANTSTTAYRRQVAIAHTQFEQTLNATTESQSLPSAGPLQVGIDLSPSTLKSTAEPLNVALEGAGFFVLQSGNDVLLTRRGDFRLSQDGTLTSSSGKAVLGTKGLIQVGDAKPTIAADGSVTVNGSVIDQLRVVDISDKSQLIPVDESAYKIDLTQIEESESHSAVRQGFLETSNVSPVNELVQLMETMRRFEMEQKFVHAYDGMLEKALGELGKVG